LRPSSALLRELTFALEYSVDLGAQRARPATNMMAADIEAAVWKTRVHQTTSTQARASP